jgi:hypothetical protein
MLMFKTSGKMGVAKAQDGSRTIKLEKPVPILPTMLVLDEKGKIIARRHPKHLTGLCTSSKQSAFRQRCLQNKDPHVGHAGSGGRPAQASSQRIDSSDPEQTAGKK